MDFERPGDSESSSNSRFDFERLERSIEQLLDDHERLGAEHEALIFELVERQHKIAALESELQLERSRRSKAVDVVDRVLTRVETLEQTLDIPGRGKIRGESDDETRDSTASEAR